MKPTNELRWVKREVYDEKTDFFGHIIQVLQQKWVNEYTYPDERTKHTVYEWRDVPVEEETP